MLTCDISKQYLGVSSSKMLSSFVGKLSNSPHLLGLNLQKKGQLVFVYTF